MKHSAIYEGAVWHERTEPRHAFRNRLFLMYLDLDELPRLFDGRLLWSSGRPNAVWFRRADYMGPGDRPLKQAVLDRVEAELGRRPDGAVRVLTQLRTFGYLFNPVSFYYCFDAAGALEAIAAEITNTPWRERRTYVLDVREGTGDELTWRFDKDFHVSPFHGMDHEYRWTFDVPGDELSVRMTNERKGREVFRVGLGCRRRELSARSLASALVRYPWLTLRVHLAIYVQAALLWLKRARFHPHPDKRPDLARTTT